MPRGFVLYQGPSLLDGLPIVAIATMRSTNPKTGPVPQTWILRADVPPMDAVRTGADASIDTAKGTHTMIDLESFQVKLTELLSLHRDSVVADCNANACGSRWDHARANEAEARFERARELFEHQFAGAPLPEED